MSEDEARERLAAVVSAADWGAFVTGAWTNDDLRIADGVIAALRNDPELLAAVVGGNTQNGIVGTAIMRRAVGPWCDMPPRS